MSFPRRAAILLLLVPILLSGCAFWRSKRQRAPYKKLSPPIAYEMMRDNPEMLVIDLRPPQEFNGETGHVRRARNIPLDRLPFRWLEISAFREDTVLVYCRNDGCGDQGVEFLLSSGFENVVLMEGGIDKWIQDGFKTVLPTSIAGRPAPPADGRGPLMPTRPGKPSNEVTVEPPQPDPTPPPPGLS
jgi:rhodanese-related sulfurtransferase